MKRFMLMLMVALAVLALAGCGEEKTKILHCDNCNTEIEVPESSAMTEEWMLYCVKCNKELGIDEQLKLDVPEFGEEK